MDREKVSGVFREILDRYGDAILQDPRRFGGAVQDLINEPCYSDERIVLRHALESSALLDALAYRPVPEDVVRQMVERLRKECRMTAEDAEFVARCAVAARGGKPESRAEEKPVPPEPAPLKPQSPPITQPPSPPSPPIVALPSPPALPQQGSVSQKYTGRRVNRRKWLLAGMGVVLLLLAVWAIVWQPWLYKKYGDGWQITGYRGMRADIEIPSAIRGMPVVRIGDRAFYFDSLTSVTIPDSVTEIGASAFEKCDSLTSITIPSSVTTIGANAFDDCDSLTSITIPDSVTAIGDHAFSRCDSLASITIPDSVTKIGVGTFFACDSLTSVTIPDSVTVIEACAFESCDSLTSITIPESVTEIGGWAFRHCDSLTSITIPDSVTEIGANAFAYCDGLTSITIPNSVTAIGRNAFCDCENLTSVSVPANCTIADTAFNNCPNVTINRRSAGGGGWVTLSLRRAALKQRLEELRAQAGSSQADIDQTELQLRAAEAELEALSDSIQADIKAENIRLA